MTSLFPSLFSPAHRCFDLRTSIRSDGWERIKAIAYKLESIAIEKEVILFTASQVNEKRQTREGRDIYNASTTVLDLLNHWHASVKSNDELKKLYKDQIDGKDVCSLSAFKQKHGTSFAPDNFFLFNGFAIEKSRWEGGLIGIQRYRSGEEKAIL